ncbi:uncharacterized protein LOC105420088 [Amborella trichopoda]|uniref:uncharacterized protein LOC105420088 n=1 Tax=Amborella trichopoda TaxID=13333 RepID=UPI0005D3F1D8|nr:uncharacterized protein LOC105420088 [Amborella trichopoda]|eukprot:XP_011620640.1 uncharacterized protein LOC105420088 [Amborella trichopoda]
MPTQSTPTSEQNHSNLMERFRRMAPPTFLGYGGVEKAERWKKHIGKILEVLHFSDEQKFRLGTFMHNGEAEYWWDLVKQAWIKERKEVEFVKLQQGSMTVEQYVARFAELSRYGPHFINTEARKAAKLERDLQPDIKSRVMLTNIKSYIHMVDHALKMEKDYEDHRLREEGKRQTASSKMFGKKPWQSSRRKAGGRPYPPNSRIPKNLSNNMGNDHRPNCTYCRRSNHTDA